MATATSSAGRYTPTGAGFNNPNFPNHYGPHDARIIIYGYTPSFALCIVAIVLFAISTVVHLLQVIRYRVWTFLLITFACLLETIGYVFRTLSSRNDPYNVIWFVVQYFLIVVAPVFISAGIYFSINGLIAWAATVGVDGAAAADDDGNTKKKRQWWLSRKLILWGFITADVLTTIMQIAGAAIVGSSESNGKDPNTGNNILLAGLAMQTFSFTAFLLVLLLFRISLSVHSNNKDVRSKDAFILAVAAASLLVYLRTVFRLAETAQGLFGSVSTNEKFFGTLEFAPVLLAVAILCVCHPGRWLARATPSSSSSQVAPSSTPPPPQMQMQMPLQQ